MNTTLTRPSVQRSIDLIDKFAESARNTQTALDLDLVPVPVDWDMRDTEGDYRFTQAQIDQFN